MPRFIQSNQKSLQFMDSLQHGLIMLAALYVIALTLPATVQAQEALADAAHYSIPPGSLEQSINRFASQAGIAISMDADKIKNLTASRLEGNYSVETGLAALLKNSGFTFERNRSGYVLVQKNVTLKPSDTATQILPEIMITSTGENFEKPYAVTQTSTATKTDTPIMQTPASVQVIPEVVIKDQQAFRLQDVVKNVSGVQPWHGYGGEIQSFIVRGFLQSSLNYRNGIRIPATKFDLANVERVEVLKGASAMLYGFSDPGGMISTVTKQPESEPYYSVEQRFGSYNFFRTEVNATGPLSREHGLNYRIDLSYLDTDSFRQFISHDRIFLAPSLSWQVTPDTRMTLSYEYLDENNSYDWGIPAFGNRLAKIPLSRTFAQPGLQNQQVNHLIDFRIDHRYNDNIRFNAGTVAARNLKNWQSIYTGRVVEKLDPQNPDRKLGDADRFYWFSPEKVGTLTAWVNGIFDFETYGVKHKVLLGGEYHVTELDYQGANDKADTINIFTFDPRQSNLPIDQIRNLPMDTFFVSTRSTSQAIYLQNQMTFWEKLHILGGFRYDWVERSQNLSWWAPDAIDARNDGFISPRVGILYEPTSWLSLFGSFSESFGPAFAYDTGGPRLYKFDSATQFEGGLKTQFFNGALIANLVYFDLEKTQLVTDPTSENIRLSVPLRGKSKGVEFDIQGQIYKGLSMIGTYAYTDTKTVADPSVPENTGNRLPYAPVHQGSIWLKYDFDYEWLKGFSLGAGVFAAGRRYGDAANSYFDDTYARVDLMAAYRKRLGRTMMTAQLNINNVNDAEYFILRNRRSNLPAEPLIVMGSIRLQY